MVGLQSETQYGDDVWRQFPTPCYVVDEKKLVQNLTILHDLETDTGCHVLLAQKAFSMYRLYPLIGRYISGTTASGLYEARLAAEEMGKENHVFAPAYKEDDIVEIARICDHVIFNSFSQFEKHKNRVAGQASIGLRVNPECSTQEGHAIYDPCAPGSRLGITREVFENVLVRDYGGELPPEVDGLHFHTLCEQNADDLITTFKEFEKKFNPYLTKIKWLNMGGGHHITRDDYQIDDLKRLIHRIQDKYQVKIYLEPGEAIALDAGYLVTEVQDVVHNGIDILILDASASCHMPDVLEMPYRPPLFGGYGAGERPYTYRLSSMTCLAGDVIGDYSFDKPVRVGDRLVFGDMAIYSMVKNNTFNGMPLPSIAILHEDGRGEVVRRFGYEDFKGRLS